VRSRRSLDWPLSREEKKACTLHLYERDVRAANELLRSKDAALGALNKELRRLSRASARASGASSTTGRGSLGGWSSDEPSEDPPVAAAAAAATNGPPPPPPTGTKNPAALPAAGALGEDGSSSPSSSPRCPPPPWLLGRGRGPRRSGAAGPPRPALRASLRGTASLRPKVLEEEEEEGEVASAILPVQEFQNSDSAVSCLCFGQERFHKLYMLLAAAFEDGDVVIFRCHRTEMERAMLLNECQLPISPGLHRSPYWSLDASDGATSSDIAVHVRLRGHARAVTSMFFNPSEDALVTMSEDGSVRFWDVDTGEVLQTLRDSRPVQAAVFSPLQPQIFLSGGAGGLLRSIDVRAATPLRRLRLCRAAIRALAFDGSGAFLLAGTASGSLHVLAGSDPTTLTQQFEVLVAAEALLDLALARPPPGGGGAPAGGLLVATTASSVCIIDCVYSSLGGLTCLAVRRRLALQPPPPPPQLVAAAAGSSSRRRAIAVVGAGSHAIYGAEDSELLIIPLSSGGGSGRPTQQQGGPTQQQGGQPLRHHRVAVQAVAVNRQDTLLASGDDSGRIVLWRRLQFA